MNFFCGVAPDGCESCASYDEAGAESKPEAYGSAVVAEGDEVADGETDDPVADDLHDEAGLSVACAAEGSSSSDLEAVKELEDGGYEEQWESRSDDGWVFGERAGDGAGKEEIDGGEAGHGSSSEGNGGPSCRSCVVGSLAAYGLTDADCPSGGDGEGHHEGEACTVESDLVS